MLNQELIATGLSDKESSFYLALLELGEAQIGQIAHKSGLKRTTCYDILESLRQKGLIFSIRKNRKNVFFAAEPHKIEDFLEEKKQKLKKIMPELLSLANLLENKPRIRFFEGFDGIKNAYKDTLKYPDQELLAWVSEEAVVAFDEKFLNEYYLPKRSEKKIWVRAIAPNKEFMQKYKGLDEKSLRRTKLTTINALPLEVEINLYGKNKIAIMAFKEKIALTIESLAIYNTLKSIFEMNWESLN